MKSGNFHLRPSGLALQIEKVRKNTLLQLPDPHFNEFGEKVSIRRVHELRIKIKAVPWGKWVKITMIL